MSSSSQTASASGTASTSSQSDAKASASMNGQVQGAPGQAEAGRAPSEEKSPSASAADTNHRSPLADFDPLAPYRGAVRRFFVVYRHVMGLLMGGHIAYVRSLPDVQTRGMRSLGKRMMAWIFRPLVDRSLRNLPFPVQLRKRLEILGPTFTKLGQILAIREDLLPPAITRELESLMDHLPPVPFVQVKDIIERDLGAPVEELFATLSSEPLGSASIAQAHRATTVKGDDVVIKVIKPGIREIINSDLKLLEFFGIFLNWIIPEYRPRQIIEEFSEYTKREVDYSFEATNAEVFAANFSDMPGVVFPTIYRELSSDDVLTMQFIDGIRPGSAASLQLSEDERERVIDLGSEAIIRMLYKDGFFHADLHAGNLKIIEGGPNEPVKVGFIDMGMVGRFSPQVKRRLLYYFYALVRGDVENVARYLLDIARIGEGGDPQGFRRAVSDLSRYFARQGQTGTISIAQLILESLSLGGRYRVFFPVEMTLMVKALVTFEGVGRTMKPDLDVVAVSQRHVRSIFRERFDPRTLGGELLSNAPEFIDTLVQLPRLMSSGSAYVEERLNDRTPSGDPFPGLRGSILAGACIIGGALGVVQGGPIWLWLPLFAIGFLLALFKT
ncbi:MAG: AarF/UbiB family protein [Longimonas sp.]|uniref:ABC1 kinase family protein n=1 Tax=Longimonas sp. TaxID=2039626 RepID=UPI0039758A81